MWDGRAGVPSSGHDAGVARRALPRLLSTGVCLEEWRGWYVGVRVFIDHLLVRSQPTFVHDHVDRLGVKPPHN